MCYIKKHEEKSWLINRNVLQDNFEYSEDNIIFLLQFLTWGEEVSSKLKEFKFVMFTVWLFWTTQFKIQISIKTTTAKSPMWWYNVGMF